jgi:large subunit ribosomal protein L4e
MFQPTKTWRKWHRKINLNQKRFALTSAIAASSIPSVVTARGHRINDVQEIPLVISNEASAITKTRDANALFKALGLEDELVRCKESKKLRAGHGKWRNRRWRRRVGPIVVYDNTQGIHLAVRNLPGVESVHVDNLSLLQMAPGGHLGRLVVWTQGAFERLQSLFSDECKNGYSLPRSIMSNPDLARLINSDEVQSKLRPAILRVNRMPRKKNPLKNLSVRVRLDPHFLTKQKRAEEQKARGVARRSEKITKNRVRAGMKAQRQAFHKQMTAEGEIIF